MFKKFPVIVLTILFFSCSKPKSAYTEFYPVLISRESLESSVKFHAPEKIISPAKIYYKDQYLFISERFKGIHIIDNSDPQNPVNKGYISVPGCVDMAIRGNVLYADNAVDLVAIDLNSAELNSLKVTKRVRNVFPEIAPPDGKELPDQFRKESRPNNTILVAWKK